MHALVSCGCFPSCPGVISRENFLWLGRHQTFWVCYSFPTPVCPEWHSAHLFSLYSQEWHNHSKLISTARGRECNADQQVMMIVFWHLACSYVYLRHVHLRTLQKVVSVVTMEGEKKKEGRLKKKAWCPRAKLAIRGDEWRVSISKLIVTLRRIQLHS